MSEKYQGPSEASPLEAAAMAGGLIRRRGASTAGVEGQQLGKDPEGSFRLWQRALNAEVEALAKTIEQLEVQLTPYLMPQSDAEALSKDAEPSAPQSELTGWVETSAMAVKMIRAHVSRLTQRLEL